MSAMNFIKAVATKSLTKNRGSGIRSIPSAIQAEAKAGEFLAILQQAGIPINQLDDYIRSEADVLKFLNIIEASSKPRVIPGTSAEGKAITEKLFGKRGEVVDMTGKKMDTSQGIMGGKSVKELMESGQVQKGTDDIKISEKITDREMFKNSNLNKPTIEGQMEKITGASNRIKEIQKEQAAMYKPKVDTVEETISYIKTLEPITAMKEANLVIGRKGKYKNLTPEESKKILIDTEDHIFERDIPIDPEDMAKGGRAGFYTGGITDVEPSLDDIGHGSDSLMSRTRLMSPGSQATTSTGLNYLLAEDNDNLRVPFENGGDMQSKIDEMIKHYQKYLKMPGKQKRKIPLKKFAEMFATENFADGGRIGFSDGKNFEMYLREREGIEKNQNMKRLYEEYLEDMRRKKVANQKQMVADGGRIGFSGGGGMSKRAFLKLLAALTGGAAAVKSGIIGLGEGTTKKAVTEAVKQSAGSGTVPPYFLNLVKKIKNLGDDAPRLATKDREKVTTYKDYTLTEDVTTGEQTIQRMKVTDDGSEAYYGQPLTEETYMSYKPGKGQMDETMKGKTPPDEYEEGTALLRNDRGNTGEIVDESPNISDDVIEEGTVFEDNMTEFSKADGGRIGFSAGSLAKLGITGSSRRFLEKVFGKERFATMIENDPRMHRGMLEVVEMFRKKDKEGLKMYMQKFLPHMDDATVEDFIIGSDGTEGITGQLIRLGSGREYKSLMDLKKQADNVRKLEDFDIDGVSKNAEGGRIGFSGGGIFRAIIAKAAAKKGMKPYEFIKVTSYKSLPPEVKMFLSAEDFARLKSGQQEMYTNYIDMAKTRKNFQEQVEGGKATPAKPLFEHMEKTMDKQSYVPKNVTSDDIAEMELMVKNRFNKGRKDNAQGGLQTMLGE